MQLRAIIYFVGALPGVFLNKNNVQSSSLAQAAPHLLLDVGWFLLVSDDSQNFEQQQL